jgi:hypothetical protein
MGGVDLANQYRESYETHKTTQRTWWPLFYWLIDVACINAYRLHQLHQEKPLSHLEFRIHLATKLLNYSSKARLNTLCIGLGGRRLFGPELQHLHYWAKRPIRATCAWCLYESRCRKVLGKGVKGQRINRSVGGCVFCNVALCAEGQCWSRYHSNNANCS